MTNSKTSFELLREHDAALSEIIDILTKHKVSGEDGEQLLLWLAGCSAGIRQQPILGDWIEPIAMAWQIGVKEGSQ